jgi:alpha-tubulin suppressor-like RCC1 family protein
VVVGPSLRDRALGLLLSILTASLVAANTLGACSDLSDLARNDIGPDGSSNDAVAGGQDGGVDENAPPADAPADAAPCLVPADPSFLVDAVDVSAGSHHACAIRQDGSVVCWGLNTFAQLGIDPSISKSVRPLRVTLPAGTALPVRLSAGFDSTCMLDSSSAVWCWGNQALGELGNGVVDAGPTPTPVRVLDGNGMPLVATQISTGNQSACAVTVSGIVQCWGNNATGIVGDASVGAVSPVAAPVVGLRALEPGGELGVGPGFLHMCMTDRIGTVCWGSADHGELGSAVPTGTIYTAVASEVSAIQGTPPLVHIAVGLGHSCALDSNNALYCWGANYSGQMGSAVLGGTRLPVAPVDGGPFIALGSQRQTCGITPDHHAVCFGDNAYGGLGRGTMGDSLQPSPAPVLDTDAGGRLSGITQISTGDHFTCARLASSCGEAGAGPVVCWGRGVEGQLGVAVDGGGGAPFPQVVQGP